MCGQPDEIWKKEGFLSLLYQQFNDLRISNQAYCSDRFMIMNLISHNLWKTLLEMLTQIGRGLSSANSDGVEKMIGIGLSKIKFRLS